VKKGLQFFFESEILEFLQKLRRLARFGYLVGYVITAHCCIRSWRVSSKVRFSTKCRNRWSATDDGWWWVWNWIAENLLISSNETTNYWCSSQKDKM